MATVFRGPTVFKTWLRDPNGVAIGSQGYVWQNPLLAKLKGQDTFFGAKGMGPDYDWPNPTLPKDRRVAILTTLEQQSDRLNNLLKGQDTFFGPKGLGPDYDWPNPTLPKDRRVAVLTTLEQQSDRLNNLLKGKDTFFDGPGYGPDYDWPNPTLPKSRQVAQLTTLEQQSDRLNNLLIGKDRIYRGPGEVPTYDWTNPVWPKSSFVAITSEPGVWQARNVTLYVGKDRLPFSQTNWPNPNRVKGEDEAYLKAQGDVWQNSQGTLFIVQPPFSQDDWPNPILPSEPRGSALRSQPGVWQNLQGTLLYVNYVLNGPLVFRNWSRDATAAIRAENEAWQNGLLSVLAGQDRIYAGPGQVPTYDMPPPVPAVSRSVAITAQSNVFVNIALVLALVAGPLTNDDQPNPAPAPSRAVAIQAQANVWQNPLPTLLPGKDKLPVLNFDWPNPTRLKDPRAAVTNSEDGVWQSNLLELLRGQDFLPFAQDDWPNPILAISRLVSEISQPDGQPGLLGLLVGKDALPFAQDDWPNPTLAISRLVAEICQPDGQPGLLGLLVGKDFLPFSLDDWPNPVLPKSRDVAIRAEAEVWQDRLLNILIGKDALPFFQTDWPVTRVKPRAVTQDPQNLLAALLSGGVVQRPFALYEWPNPTRAALRLFSQDSVSGGLAPFVIPFAQYDWPLPRSIRHAPGFISDLPQAFYAFGTKPFTQGDWPNPRGPARPVVYDSQNIIAILGTPKPFAIYDWPNPVRATYRINGQESSLVFGLASTVRPFAQYEWPNPILATSRGAALNSEESVWQDPLLNVLAGQDAFFGGPGRGPVYDYPNPNRLKEPWGPALRAQGDAWRNPLGHARVIIGHTRLLGSEVLAQLTGSETKPTLLGSKTEAELKGSKAPSNLLGSKLASQLKGDLDDD